MALNSCASREEKPPDDVPRESDEGEPHCKFALSKFRVNDSKSKKRAGKLAREVSDNRIRVHRVGIPPHVRHCCHRTFSSPGFFLPNKEIILHRILDASPYTNELFSENDKVFAEPIVVQGGGSLRRVTDKLAESSERERIRAVTTQAALTKERGGNSAKRRDSKADNNELHFPGRKAFVLIPSPPPPALSRIEKSLYRGRGHPRGGREPENICSASRLPRSIAPASDVSELNARFRNNNAEK